MYSWKLGHVSLREQDTTKCIPGKLCTYGSNLALIVTQTFALKAVECLLKALYNNNNNNNNNSS